MTRIYFKKSGFGMAIVCLHAFALDHAVWLKVAEQLESSSQMILTDLRGHGKSQVPDGIYSMRDMGGDVISVLDSLNIEKALFAGNSMGGYVALAIAKYFPDRINGLALVASHAFADSSEKKQSRMDDIKKVKEAGLQVVLDEMPFKLTRNPEIQEYCQEKIRNMNPNGVIGSLAGMAEREDSIEILKNLNKPVGIIAGKDDQIIPIDSSRKMADLISPSIYVEIEDCGHLPMLENPERVSDALKILLSLSKETTE